MRLALGGHSANSWKSRSDGQRLSLGNGQNVQTRQFLTSPDILLPSRIVHMETNDKGEIELLTVKEVAKLLRLSESKVRDLQCTRRLPFIKVGGAVRFEKREIVEYLKRKT